MNNVLTIEGYIKKAIFDKGGDFKVFSFVPLLKYHDVLKIHPTYKNISISGNLPSMSQDILYKLDVEYVKKDGYDNYIVKRIYAPKKEMDKEAAIKFLKTATSETRALELFKVYPDIVNMMLDGKDIDVSKLKNIGKKTIEDVRAKVVENFQLFDLVEEYKDYDMTLSMIRKVYDEYKSVDKVKEMMEGDPYYCLTKINRVGFKTADAIIMSKMPHKIDSKMRALACIRYLLNENELNGNTWIDVKLLLNKFNELASESKKHFPDILKNNDEINYDAATKTVSYKKTIDCEAEISNILKDIYDNSTKWSDIDCNKYKTVNGVELSDEQMNILKSICENDVNILAGFGGTGKSFSMQGVVNMLEDNNKSYLILASTGKASKVLSYYLNRDVKTIHRGLEYNYSYGFKYGIGSYIYDDEEYEREKLDYDMVIIEEFSMIDIFLLRDLLRAIEVGRTKILFIGDPAQIPSVAAGNVSYDMVNSGVIPTSLLTTVFRYGEGGLSYVATKIRNGERYLQGNKSIEVFGINKDYMFINAEQEETHKIVSSIYNKHLKDGATIDDLMVVTAYNKGSYGTVALNKVIQDLVNPIEEDVVVTRNGNEIIFRVDDKVMQIKNNYKAKLYNSKKTTEIYNGDIGVIKKIENENIIVNIDDKDIVYSKEDVKAQLDLAYAMSIHKSQGSSINHVILVTPKAHKFFLDRNLLYVAASRSRRTLSHIGTMDVVNSSLRKSANIARNTHLKDFLINKFI